MGHSADEIHVNVNGQLMNLQSAINALMATNPGGISQRIVIENSSCISDSGSNIYTLTAKCPAGYKLISCSHSEGDMRESNEGFQTIVDIENNQCIINVRKPGCESKEGETEKQRVTAVCFK